MPVLSVLRRRFNDWPLRFKIGLVVVSGMVGMAVALSAITLSTANQLFAHQAEDDLDRALTTISGEVDTLVQRSASDLLLARQNDAFQDYFRATDPVVRAEALAKVETQLLYLQKQLVIDEICLIERDGREAARCVLGRLSLPAELTPDESMHAFFHPTLTVGPEAVYWDSTPYLSPDLNYWVVAVAAPIFAGDETPVGMLHFEIPVEWFATRVAMHTLPGGHSFLMTRDGRLLAHPNLAEIQSAADPVSSEHTGFPLATTLPSEDFQELVARMQTGQPGRGTFRENGETYTVLYQPVFNGQWVVATALPHSAIYRPAWELLRNILLIALPLLGLTLLAMTIFAARLVAPLQFLTHTFRQLDASARRLANHAPALTAGSTTHGPPAESAFEQLHQRGDEIGQLGSAFHHMVESLEQHEKQLAEMGANYRALFESAPDAIVVANESGDIVQANAQAVALFGYDRGQLIGLPIDELIPADARGTHTFCRRDYFAAPQTRMMGHRPETRARRRDGHEFPTTITLSMIATAEGPLAMAIVRDISERVQHEQALAVANRELEQAVRQANALARVAQEANQLKDEFLANTTHELRTPLTGILGGLSVVMDGLCGSRAEEVEFLGMAHTAAQQLLGIINDLLDISKIGVGKMEVYLSDVDIGAVLAEVQSLFRTQSDRKGVPLILPAQSAPPVRTDRDRLRQILVNLVGNAFKFTEAGWVAIRMDYSESEGQVRLRVQDTGIGIGPEQQAKLFQPFVQANGGLTRKYGGTGLGLAIARRLAELMQGTLTLESAGIGQGCTFTLTLPLAATQDDQHAEA